MSFDFLVMQMKVAGECVREDREDVEVADRLRMYKGKQGLTSGRREGDRQVQAAAKFMHHKMTYRAGWPWAKVSHCHETW